MKTIQQEILEQLARVNEELNESKARVEELEDMAKDLHEAVDCNHDWECLGGSLLIEERCTECGYTRFV